MNHNAENSLKRNCYFLYDKEKNKYKTTKQIKDKFKCQLTKKGHKKLYVKRDNKNIYDFVSQTKLIENGCITNYNKYLDPEKKVKGHKQLKLTDLFTDCSKNTFKETNPEYDRLLNYSYELSDKLKVDELIKKFITELIIYTNLNKNGLDELYKGAFIIIRDKGFFYNKFKCESSRICDVKKFISESSHDSLHKNPQYRIGNGVLYHCNENGTCDENKQNSVFDLLIGTSPIDHFYGDTWIQFEYANLLTVWNKYTLHAYSFIIHKLTGKNVGPLGESDYAEYKKPLILEICNPTNCNKNICDPVPCVRPLINLNNYSQDFLKSKKINMSEYKQVKDLVKSIFDSKTKYSIQNIILELDDYIEIHNNPNLFVSTRTSHNYYDIITMILPYIKQLVSLKPYQYDREEIIELVFLAFSLYKNNNVNYNEFKTTIKKRYFNNKYFNEVSLSREINESANNIFLTPQLEDNVGSRKSYYSAKNIRNHSRHSMYSIK
jgi:hypothetical protein